MVQADNIKVTSKKKKTPIPTPNKVRPQKEAISITVDTVTFDYKHLCILIGKKDPINVEISKDILIKTREASLDKNEELNSSTKVILYKKGRTYLILSGYNVVCRLLEVDKVLEGNTMVVASVVTDTIIRRVRLPDAPLTRDALINKLSTIGNERFKVKM